jgi:hypothetical protein
LRHFCKRKTLPHQIKFDLVRAFWALTNFCSVTGVTLFRGFVSKSVRLTLSFKRKISLKRNLKTNWKSLFPEGTIQKKQKNHGWLSVARSLLHLHFIYHFLLHHAVGLTLLV